MQLDGQFSVGGNTEHLRDYLDYEDLADDWQNSGDVHFAQDKGQVWVFSTH